MPDRHAKASPSGAHKWDIHQQSQSNLCASPSGAHKWTNCTKSLALESQFPNEDTDATREGTVAHALAEHKLRRALQQHPNLRPDLDLVDGEMEEHTDDYVTYVLERLALARQEFPGARVMVEQELDLSADVAGSFGTADCIILSQPVLEVIDFKYGFNPVQAEGNPQLRLYALGAFRAYGMLYDFTHVRATIFQPRRGAVLSETITTQALEQWAVEVIQPAAVKALAGEGEYRAGEWCGYCKAKNVCRARAEAQLELAKFEFAKPDTLTTEEIAGILTQIPALTKWAGDIQSYALSAVLNQGIRFEGFKVVAGRALRKYTDETAVAEIGESQGLEVYEKKLKSPAALEKQVGKKTFQTLFADLVTKPSGKPSLVPVSDPRPELTIATAADEFTPIQPDDSNTAATGSISKQGDNK
ncbi:DUF2800 domain-containing protein [Rothia sp. ZJ1223]|uniref:DUF2800 domain-containing protein n=1 Tax=Rothia sp. ZJ1223 TaxID=2811098 RepID=UPI0019573AF2|nr:DUF2800 domain-containing protein [Rothia sp. ZJ1223]MBM7051019.1 DUF2800 domain-containing protein [Rothia sp. ZJ1223]